MSFVWNKISKFSVFSWFCNGFSLIKSTWFSIFYAKCISIHRILILYDLDFSKLAFWIFLKTRIVGSFVFLIFHCVINAQVLPSSCPLLRPFVENTWRTVKYTLTKFGFRQIHCIESVRTLDMNDEKALHFDEPWVSKGIGSLQNTHWIKYVWCWKHKRLSMFRQWFGIILQTRIYVQPSSDWLENEVISKKKKNPFLSLSFIFLL